MVDTADSTGRDGETASSRSAERGPRLTSRRSAIRLGAVVLGGAALGVGSPTDRLLAASAAPSRAAFESCVGARFKLHSVTGLTSLTLFKVRSLANTTLGGGESFSLLFRGPTTPTLPQGVFTLEHRRTGRFNVLTVPMRPEPDARYYEIIFNRSAAG